MVEVIVLDDLHVYAVAIDEAAPEQPTAMLQAVLRALMQQLKLYMPAYPHVHFTALVQPFLPPQSSHACFANDGGAMDRCVVGLLVVIVELLPCAMMLAVK